MARDRGNRQLMKLPVSTKSDYQTLLDVCVTNLWAVGDKDSPAASAANEYYLADASGARILGGNELQWYGPSEEDGTSHQIPWTLENYMKLSGCFPSRLRLYCVRVSRDHDGKSPVLILFNNPVMISLQHL